MKFILKCLCSFFLVWGLNSQTLQSGYILSFQENKGQIKDQNNQLRSDILFSGSNQGMDFFLGLTGMHYQFCKIDRWQTVENKNAVLSFEQAEELSFYRIDVNWIGIQNSIDIQALDPLNGYEHFYNVSTGQEPALFVKSYRKVLYHNLYPGVDLQFFEGKHQGLEYDFIIQPGYDYKQIQLEFKGAELSVSEDQELIISTPFGTIKEGQLKVLQGNKEIPAKWLVVGDRVSFEIGPYDKSKPLIIDPPVLVWSTYCGGNRSDNASDVTTDASGYAFISGNTFSTQGIATSGSHQQTAAGTLIQDGFLSKFSPSGQKIWSTYYGGDYAESGGMNCLDELGNIYLCGSTQSGNNMASTGSFQDTLNGGSFDAYLVKFNSNGVREWSTYYGGAQLDYGMDCVADEMGNIYLCGETKSLTGLSTSGAHQMELGGDSDGYIVKFSPTGNRLWGTYYGGSDYDRFVSCDLAPNGSMILAGNTSSPDNICTLGTHKDTLNGNMNDAMLVAISSAGTRQWATYFGGENSEYSFSNSIDEEGNIYLVGSTRSPADIATPGSFQENLSGTMDGYLAKFDPNANLIWASYYGGDSTEILTDCIVNAYGEIYVCGITESGNQISSSQSYQENFAGMSDAFLVKMDNDGERLWSTYFGGTEIDYGVSCSLDNAGHVYLFGSTNSSGLATPGAYKENLDSIPYDAFLTKFNNFGLGLEDQDELNPTLLLYPNPSSGNLSLDLHRSFENIEIKITDLNGKRVEEYHFEHIQMIHFPFTQSKGIYLLFVTLDGNQRQAIKLIKN